MAIQKIGHGEHGPRIRGFAGEILQAKIFYYFCPFFNDRELKMVDGESISAKMETARNMELQDVAVQAHPPYSGNQVS